MCDRWYLLVFLLRDGLLVFCKVQRFHQTWGSHVDDGNTCLLTIISGGTWPTKGRPILGNNSFEIGNGPMYVESTMSSITFWVAKFLGANSFPLDIILIVILIVPTLVASYWYGFSLHENDIYICIWAPNRNCDSECILPSPRNCEEGMDFFQTWRVFWETFQIRGGCKLV